MSRFRKKRKQTRAQGERENEMRRGREGGVEIGEAELGPYLIGIQQQSPSAGRRSCRRRREGRRCSVGGWGRLHSSAESKSWVVPPYTLSPPFLKGDFVFAKKNTNKQKKLQMIINRVTCRVQEMSEFFASKVSWLSEVHGLSVGSGLCVMMFHIYDKIVSLNILWGKNC